MFRCCSPLVRNICTRRTPANPSALTAAHQLSLCRRFADAKSVADESSSTLEIELKFRCTPTIAAYCTLHSTQIEDMELCDIYFDSPDYELTKRDLWLRSRNGVLELKAPPSQTVHVDDNGGVSTVDFYRESTQLADIAHKVLHYTQRKIDFTASNDGIPDSNERSCDEFVCIGAEALHRSGIHPFGTIVSRRRRHLLRVPLSDTLLRRWNQCSQFRLLSPIPSFQDVFVDLDFVSYVTPDQQRNQESKGASDTPNGFECSDYQIGEIEFVNAGLVSILDGAASTSTPEERVSFQQALMRGVCAAVGVEDLSPVRGKVLEYLCRMRPAHYQALRDCGQLASKGI